MTATTTPRRAIWGLVNDGYALVAKTANLSHDDAFELCRVPDIGDPSAFLDQGIAYLRSPKWGHVFARYFTNAERDSAGRASLVYDVVALSDADFAATGNDPFRALPPLSEDRRPERLGELPRPSLPARDETQEARRLAELIAGEDPTTLATLLGALLGGDRVLWVGGGLRPQTIECVTLLLPPSLRTLMTFQAPTVDYPKHTPRLTMAERGNALLLEREWTAVLPRDAEDPRLADARANAARLAALGRLPDRLRQVWAAASDVSDSDLGIGIARVLRLDVLNEGLRSGDLRRAVLVPARAEQWDERLRLTNGLLEQANADRVALALSEVIRGEQRGGWAAAHAIGLAVAHGRDIQRARFREFFLGLIDRLRDIPPPVGDESARNVRVMLACAAAALDDVERFLAVADANLPWELAWHDGSARWVKGRSPVARLFDALAPKGATYGDALDGLQAITQVSGTTTGPSRQRASAIALMLVRRTLRERATLEPPDRLGALVDGLVRFWTATDAKSQPSADNVERAVRRFLGVSDATPASSDPRRIAADLVRALAESDSAGEEELTGWVIAALDRAHVGAVGEHSVRVVVALLDDQRRVAPRGELASQVGQVLLHFAATDAAFVFRPAWLDIVRQADDTSRRELFTRALAWVARGYASGRFTVGAFADACAAAGAEGGTIDDATVDLLVPHLANGSGSRASATELGVVTAMIASVATPAAAERLTEALLGSADPAVADRIRMHRLALALHDIERVRDEDRYADARATLQRVIASGTLGAGEERALRTFLGVDDGSVIGRLMSRLPRLANGGIATVGERR